MIILRYDEIGLKSRFVRRRFEDVLINNVRRVLKKEFNIKDRIKRDYGRIYVLSDDENIAIRISKIFGVVYAETAKKMELDLPKNAVEIAESWRDRVKGRSFAVRVRRSGNHDFTSMDAAKMIGQKIKEITGSRVDLKNPDVEIKIEIRDDHVYLITNSFPGYGGLPTGTQERVVSILNDKKALLSTWFALKRGCDVDVLIDPAYTIDTIDPVDVMEFWAAYRKIEVIQSEGDTERLLERAYKLDYKGIYCSITAEEFDSLYDVLTRRTKPVYMPLLPFSNREIDELIEKIIREAGIDE